MKTNYGFAIIIFLCSLHIYSQEMPLDFSDSEDNFIPYAGASFSTRIDPNDTSNIVGEFFNDGSNSNQGFYIDVLVDLDIQQNIIVIFVTSYLILGLIYLVKYKLFMLNSIRPQI